MSSTTSSTTSSVTSTLPAVSVPTTPPSSPSAVLSGQPAGGSFATGLQYGFFFDQSRCDGCNTCQVACKGWHQLLPGPGKMCRVLQWETGTFVNVRQNVLFAPCYHCANPPCVAVANGALIKEPNYGAVLIDPALATSPDLKTAQQACPYGAIAFDSDAANSTAFKCTMCIDRLVTGFYPACVMACTIRALDFDTIPNLVKKYGNNQQLAGMPAATTYPSVVFKPMKARLTLVPYDENEALTLLGGTLGSGTPGIADPSKVTSVPAGATKDHPVFFAANSAEFMVATTDDTA